MRPTEHELFIWYRSFILINNQTSHRFFLFFFGSVGVRFGPSLGSAQPFQLPFSNPLFVFPPCEYIHSEPAAPEGAARLLCGGCNPRRSRAVRAYARPSVRIRDRPHNCAPTRRPVTDSVLQSSPRPLRGKKFIWAQSK